MVQDKKIDWGGFCVSLVMVAVFVIIILLLSLLLLLFIPPIDPKCSIEYFYVPALNKTLNSQLNTTLSFMVLFKNPNKDRGIYYDDVNISFSDKTNSSIANYTVPRFYQLSKKIAKNWGEVLLVNNEAVLRAVLPNGSAVFRMDLMTQVRFHKLFLKSKRYDIEVGADVEVNGDGVKANKKGIKMKKSDSTSLRSYFLFCAIMNLLVIFAIC